MFYLGGETMNCQLNPGAESCRTCGYLGQFCDGDTATSCARDPKRRDCSKCSHNDLCVVQHYDFLWGDTDQEFLRQYTERRLH